MADCWLSRELVCPVDKLDLLEKGGELVCIDGHQYPIVGGIPVMLVRGSRQTHPAAARSLGYADGRVSLTEHAAGGAGSFQIDPFVHREIAATNGRMFRHLVLRLSEYPIPMLLLPKADGAERHFLELGSNWGRWCIAAARSGYHPVGLEPSLDAVRAAYRVAEQLGIRASYIVGDARYLPFRSSRFSVVFSYSVLQHFERGDAALALGEAGRVVSDDGLVMIQMANALGVRSLYHQLRRGFRRATGFEVRYWTPWALKTVAEGVIGSARLKVDGFFTLNPQPSEARLLPRRFRYVIRASEALRRMSTNVPALVFVADSLYVVASKAGATGGGPELADGRRQTRLRGRQA